MKKLIKDLNDFHFACDVSEFGFFENVPENIRKLRLNLLEEEFNEYKKWEKENDEMQIADAIADMIYIAVWTARVYWIPLDEVWEEVQRANMDKVDKKTWKVRKREDWKVLKPDWWIWPQIEKVIKLNKVKK